MPGKLKWDRASLPPRPTIERVVESMMDDYRRDWEERVQNDRLFQERLREMSLRARRKKGSADSEIASWWPHYLAADAELAPGWEILWQQGVVEGDEFRAHLVDPKGKRTTIRGTDHAEVFDNIRARILSLRR